MNDYYQISKQNNINLSELLNAYQKATDEHILCSITDLNGIIIYANKIFCETSQYEVYELVGKYHNIVNASYHPEMFGAENSKTGPKMEALTG